MSSHPRTQVPPKKGAPVRSWRASLIRNRSQYLGYVSTRYLGYVIADDPAAAAEVAAVTMFKLDTKQRARLVVQRRR
jgi:hypothetical protein